MLSNFQLGNHSLLQSFLVGQPEFRQILQRPEMEQFRQRVSATCHIGPLDQGETEGYILHRLKCAGSTGEPDFEPGAFPAIHAASHGIPRRINSICDRLLLLGFMEGRKHLTLADVETVLLDFAGELSAPEKVSVPLNGSGSELARLSERLGRGRHVAVAPARPERSVRQWPTTWGRSISRTSTDASSDSNSA